MNIAMFFACAMLTAAILVTLPVLTGAADRPAVGPCNPEVEVCL